MKTIVFASNNAHKLEEIRAILGSQFEIKSLKEIGCDADIPETGNTFRDNALQKAQYVKDHFGLDCFADDSGLQVEALNGEPGVFSARYAAKNNFIPSAPQAEGGSVLPAGNGSDRSGKDNLNMDCLLSKLASVTQITTPLGVSGWKACFRTSVALISDGEVHYFDGVVDGTIIAEKRGNNGFGYDPIFVPEGYDKTFAELGNEVKNGISHRARAVAKLADFLLGK